ncbi:MAG: tetratricopeptide repeat protein [Luteimonas sp.]
MRSATLLAELARRNVIRVAGLYMVGAWLVTQVAGTVLPMFGAPGWVARSVVILLAIGFVPAMGVAWVFELTPEGLKRDADVAPEASIAPQTARRLGRLIIAVLAIALAYFGLDRFVLTPRHEAARTAQVPRVRAVRATTGIPPVPAKSIAVLPFVNMSGDPANEYFSDGITEEILNALAQVPGLKVAARTSAFAFKGKAEDLRKVGQVLGVATVLEGSVQRVGDDVRITAQLIDTRSGYHQWSETYDRKLTNIFAVEDEISRAIADKLQVQLADAGGQALFARQSIDPRAHDFYLRGLTLLAARSVDEAVAAFQQSVAIEPGYAQAWAMLAEAQALLPTYGPEPMQVTNANAIQSARHALALDPDVARAHVALGMVYSNQMRWADADRALRHAVQLAPGDAEVLNQYAQFLEGVGQLDAALVVLDRALQRDPLSAISGAIRVQLRLYLRRDDPATAAARIKALISAHPESLFVHRSSTLIYLALHRYPEAEAQIRMAGLPGTRDPEAKALLIRGIADPAQRKRAVQSLETSADNADMRRDPVVHALYLLQLGERDRALQVLETSDYGRSSSITSLLWLSGFDPVREDPRFQTVLAQLGLPYTPESADLP